VLTSDVLSKTRALWAEVYGFQAKVVVKKEALWVLISSVLHRWQAQVDHVILGGDFNASLLPRLGYRPDSIVRVADALIQRSVAQLSLELSAPISAT